MTAAWYRFVAGFRTCDSCSQLGAQAEVTVLCLGARLALGGCRCGHVGAEQIRERKIRTSVAPFVVETRGTCRDERPAALNEPADCDALGVRHRTDGRKNESLQT